ncbi:hypothetical protein [Brevundimonas sp. C43]|uniref:hypothetical protein n=1 Tax=Brevundimonas sp. C43 TaxID=3068314 RepID=UPI00273E8388|nr:hypothetical protein [Brevundimonas sp. C43]
MDVLLYLILPWVALYYAMMAVVGVCNGLKRVWIEMRGGQEAASRREEDIRRRAAYATHLKNYRDDARRQAQREAGAARLIAQRAAAQRIKTNVASFFK